MAHGVIRVGIGGWIYEPWRETFYPPKLAKTKELAHASRAVTTIEINATFYRSQSPATFAKWAAEAPDGFVFSVKANRYAVNRRDLREAKDSIERFCDGGITALGPKLGPILWQFAGTKRFDADEIDAFLALLPKTQDGLRLRHAIEPRHPSFVTPEIIEIARRHGVAVVLALSDDYPLIADPSADFCYLRLQTASAEAPEGYDATTLQLWADRVRDIAAGKLPRDLPLLTQADALAGGRDCFVYFIAGAKERNPAAAQALLTRLT